MIIHEQSRGWGDLPNQNGKRTQKLFCFDFIKLKSFACQRNLRGSTHMTNLEKMSVTKMPDKGLISMQHKISNNPDVFKVKSERFFPAPKPLS